MAERKETFDEIIGGDKLVLVDFYADWCGPCKMMAPVLKQFAAEMGDRIRVLKVDVDRNEAVSSDYQIQGVPTLILFRNGKVLWRQAGVVSGAQLKQVVDNFSVATSQHS